MTSSTPHSPPAPAPEPDTPSVAGEEDPGAALDDGTPDGFEADPGDADDENGEDSAPDGDQGASGASCNPRSEPQRRA